MSSDASEDLLAAVKQAISDKSALQIQGGNTKAFYGRKPIGEALSMSTHRGVINYEPTELVLTARGGTVLKDIESELAGQNQMLPFEPPHFGEHATLGGCIACGLAGPRRPYAGAVRDFVLGVKLINGRAQQLSFGGQVMKNVAGYDVSRLMAGAMGTLGVLLEVSLKVLPRPKLERTLMFEADTLAAIDMQNRWAQKSLPISATCHQDNALYVRLSGSDKGVLAAERGLGGENFNDAAKFWSDLREQRGVFFNNARNLWRISVPPATPPLSLEGDWLMEWNGALRWLKSDAPAESIRAAAADAGGHAMLFRGGDRDRVFHPLQQSVFKLHQNLKQAFDPNRIFNPGRMYDGL